MALYGLKDPFWMETEVFMGRREEGIYKEWVKEDGDHYTNVSTRFLE